MFGGLSPFAGLTPFAGLDFTASSPVDTRPGPDPYAATRRPNGCADPYAATRRPSGYADPFAAAVRRSR